MSKSPPPSGGAEELHKLFVEARRALYEGHPERALELFLQLDAGIKSLDPRTRTVLIYQNLLAEALARCGQWDRVHDLLYNAEGALIEEDDMPGLTEHFLIGARIALLEGDQELASVYLRDAQRLAATIGAGLPRDVRDAIEALASDLEGPPSIDHHPMMSGPPLKEEKIRARIRGRPWWAFWR